MKKHGKMILPNILLVLSLLLSGCGENAEEQKEITRGGEDEKPQTSFTEKGEQWEQNTVKETDGDNPSGEKSEQPEESAEEGDLPPDESLFEYYDLLNAEYEKYGITSPSYNPHGKGMYPLHYYFSSKQQTFVFELNPSSWGENELVSYNAKTGELKTGLTPGRHPNMVMEWCGDIMYSSTFWNTGEKRIFVRNIDGSPVADGGREYIAFDGDERWEDINYYTGDIYTQPDGTMFFFADCRSKNNCGYMISPDREKLTELPRPEVEVAHGIKEARDFKIVGCWNNKVFALAGDIGFCCLDTDSLTWETLDVEHIDKSSRFKTVGRYLLSDCTVFDMETKEIIVHNDNFSKNCGSFAKSYYGGKHNIIMKGNNWYFCRCASDGSDVDLKYFESYSVDEQDAKAHYCISNEYYAYRDEYGYFLRRYETGADWEETLYLF